MKNLVQTNSKTFPFELLLKGKSKSSKGKLSKINFVDVLAANASIQSKKAFGLPSFVSSEMKVNNEIINTKTNKNLLAKPIKTKRNSFMTLPVESKKVKTIKHASGTKSAKIEQNQLTKPNTQIQIKHVNKPSSVTKQKFSSAIRNTVNTKPENFNNKKEIKISNNLILNKTKISDAGKLSINKSVKNESYSKKVERELPIININQNLKTVSKNISTDSVPTLKSKNPDQTKQVLLNDNKVNKTKLHKSFDSTLPLKNTITIGNKIFTTNSTKASLVNKSEDQYSNSNLKSENLFNNQVKYVKPELNSIKKDSESRTGKNKESIKIKTSDLKKEASSEIVTRNEQTELKPYDFKENINIQKTGFHPGLVSSNNIQKTDSKDVNKNSLSKSAKVLLNKEGSKNENLEYVKTRITSSKITNKNSFDRNAGNQISEKINQTSITDTEENFELRYSTKPLKSDNNLVQNNQINVKPIQVENLNTLTSHNIESNLNPLFTSSANSVMNTFISNTQSIVNQIIQLFEVAKPQPSNVSKFEVDLGQNEKLEIQFTKQGENHSARIVVGTESTLLSMEKIIPELKIQLENKGINFISLDVEMENYGNENTKNENHTMENKNQNNLSKLNNSNKQIIDQISAIRDFGYNTIEFLA